MQAVAEAVRDVRACGAVEPLPLCACVGGSSTEPVIHRGVEAWGWLHGDLGEPVTRGDWCVVGTEPCRLVGIDTITGRTTPSLMPMEDGDASGAGTETDGDGDGEVSSNDKSVQAG